jgi:predicted dehydrogenase
VVGTPSPRISVLDDIASHQLDLIPWLLDARVSAVSAVSAGHDPQAPAGTAVSLRLRLDGGLEARCRAGHAGSAIERLEVRLDRGALLATRGTAMRTGPLPMVAARPLAALRDRVASATGRLAGRPNVTVGSFRRQLAEWARALESGRSATAADGTAGARCVALVEACRESLARGGAWQEPPLFAKV